MKEPRFLVVRGDSSPANRSYRDNVIKEAASTLGDDFSFEGKVPPERAYRELDVMLLLNPNEPSGNVIVEAQMMGVVAVVPNTGGAAELVTNGETGFYFSHLSQLPSLLDSIAKLTRKARDHITSSARLEALSNYGSEQQSLSYLNALIE